MKTMFLSLIPLCTLTLNAQVGINTTTPEATLDIQSNELTSSTKAVRISNTEAEIVTVLDDGNVGINTSTPTAKLEIDGGIDQSGLKFTNFNSNSPTTNPEVNFLAVDENGNVVATAIGKQIVAYKTVETVLPGNTSPFTDSELSITLNPGIYEITGMLVYKADEDNDVRISFNYDGTLPSGTYTFLGKYSGSNNSNSYANTNFDYNPWNEHIALGGSNETRLCSYLNGFINVTSTLTLQMIYRNNNYPAVDLSRNDTNIYPTSYIKATRIR